MANRDIAGLLTGISSTQRPNPNMNSDQWRMAFGAQQGQNLSNAVGTPSPEQAIQMGMAKLDLTSIKGLTTLAEMQQLRGDTAGAAKTASMIQAMNIKQELGDKEIADKVSFSEYIRNKFPSQPALIQLAESGQLNASNFKDFLDDPKSGGFLKGTTFTVEDEKGNQFTMTPAFSKDGKGLENQYSPIGDGPANPIGKTRVTGGEFSLTPEDETSRRVGQKGAETKETAFGNLKIAAQDSIPTLSASKVDLDEAEKLLSSIETGGPINIAATGLEGFFGVKSADKGQLEIILGLNMMSSLKPLFGGLISNQEAERLKAIYAGMSKGNLANEGILRQLKKAVDDNLFKARLYQKTKTSEEFNTLIKQMYPEDTKPEKTRVQWSNL
jgi:hypothetical protein|tara:strand:+ start:522 stop:1673 length:1152 start_codon:yes stop_codon:yes gene_type:complete